MAYFSGDIYLEKGIAAYFFMGEKSIGKTYWGMQFAINAWETKGEGTAWLINSKEELRKFVKDEAKSTFDLKKYAITMEGITDIETGIKWGVFTSIKQPWQVKNNNWVKNVIFEEFTAANSMNFDSIYTNFCMIISNLERKKKGCKFFGFANAITNNNAIFTNLDIYIPPNGHSGEQIFYRKEKKIKFVVIPEDMYFTQEEKKGSLANIFASANDKIQGALFGNQFMLDNTNMINVEYGREGSFAQALYKVRLGEYCFAVFKTWDNTFYFDYQRKYEGIYLFARTINVMPWNMLMNNTHKTKDNDDYFESWENWIAGNKCYFATMEIREQIINFLAMRGIYE